MLNVFRVQAAPVQQGRISLALPSPHEEESSADDEKLVAGDDVVEGQGPGVNKYIPKKALVS